MCCFDFCCTLWPCQHFLKPKYREVEEGESYHIVRLFNTNISSRACYWIFLLPFAAIEYVYKHWNDTTYIPYKGYNDHKDENNRSDQSSICSCSIVDFLRFAILLLISIIMYFFIAAIDLSMIETGYGWDSVWAEKTRLEELFSTFFGSLASILEGFVAFFSFISLDISFTECAGLIRLFYVILVVIICIALTFILYGENDVLRRFQIFLLKRKTSSASMLVINRITFYILQIFCLWIQSMLIFLLSSWNTDGCCADWDIGIFYFASVIQGVSLWLFLLWFGILFTNTRMTEKQRAAWWERNYTKATWSHFLTKILLFITIQYIVYVITTILGSFALIFGVWPDMLWMMLDIDKYAKELSKESDNKNKDNNFIEEAISARVRVRALLCTIIPGGILFAKLLEATNEFPIFIIQVIGKNYSNKPHMFNRNHIKTPFKWRVLLFLSNLVRFLLAFITLLSPNIITLLVYFLSALPPAILYALNDSKSDDKNTEDVILEKVEVVKDRKDDVEEEEEEYNYEKRKEIELKEVKTVSDQKDNIELEKEEEAELKEVEAVSVQKDNIEFEKESEIKTRREAKREKLKERREKRREKKLKEEAERKD